MICDVKVKEIDTSISSGGARTLLVKKNGSSFETPIRPISSVELGAKSSMGYRGEIESPIAALQVNFSGERFELLKTNSDALNRSKMILQSQSDSTYNITSLALLQLNELLINDSETKKISKIAYDLQMDIDGLDYISMPIFNGSVDEYDNIIKQWVSGAEEYKKGVVPQLSLSENPEFFRKKLDMLSEMSQNGSIQIINIKYAPKDKCRVQLAELWAHRESLSAIINCSEVPRIGAKTTVNGVNVDEEIELIKHGFDSITRKKKTPSKKYIALLNKKPNPSDIHDVTDFKYFNHGASITLSKDVWLDMKHPPYCYCSVCRGKTRSEIIESYAYMDDGSIDKMKMNYYSKIHDHQSDMIELANLRKDISSGTVEEYDRDMIEKRRTILNDIAKN